MKAYGRYLLFLFLLIPPFIFRDYSPDNELRYISIVDEALRNHHWFTFYNHGEIYADKPPLYFWLLMFVRTVSGTYPMWLMGLISILPAIGVLMIMDKWVRSEDINFNTCTADFLLITTGFYLGSALILRMDMLMTFFIVLSLYTFYGIYKRRNRPYEKWILPVYMFLALFTKGPLGILIPLLSIGVFLAVKKEFKTIGMYFGWKQWGILSVLCMSWFIMIYMEGGQEYLNNILFKQTVGRGINSFHHNRPIYYYLKHIPLTFLPWTLVYFPVLLIGAWKRMAVTDMERLFGVIILSTFILLSLISSKLDIYLLPAYPFVAYLTVKWLQRQGHAWYVKAGIIIPALVFAVAFPASFFLTPLFPYPYENLSLGYIALFILSAGGIASLLYIWKKDINKAIVSSALGVLLLLFVVSYIIPQFNEYIGLEALARKGEELAADHQTNKYAFYKFRDGESMDIYLDKPLVRIETIEKLEEMEKEGPVVVFIGYWELGLEPDLKKWLSRQPHVYPVGEYNVLIVGRK